MSGVKNNDRWVDITELQNELDCSYSVIYSWMKEGMPYEKEGRKYIFYLPDVHNWFLKGWFNSLPPAAQAARIQKLKKTMRSLKQKTPARQ